MCDRGNCGEKLSLKGRTGNKTSDYGLAPSFKARSRTKEERLDYEPKYSKDALGASARAQKPFSTRC